MTTFLLLLTNVIGGATYPAQTVVLRGFAERDAIFLRLGFCAVLFLPFVWSARARLAALRSRDWLLLGAVGLLGYALPIALGVYGQRLSSATSASLLIGLEPVSIVALSCLFLGEPMNGYKAAATLAGLGGATLIAFQGPPRLGGAFSARLAGDLILAAHGACWSLYSVLGKPALKRVAPMDFTAVTTVIAFLGTAAWTAPGLAPGAWRAAGAGPWWALLFLAGFGTFFGAWTWNVVLSRVEASSSASFIFLQPLVGTALGALLLGDPFTRWTAAGGALVLAGMWAATRGVRPPSAGVGGELSPQSEATQQAA